jgi:hypothetical protein
MNVSEMEVGKRYVVTHDSKHKEFRVGDQIQLLDTGDILNKGWGWMEAEYLTEATVGMTIELDKEWVERRRLKLLEQLAALES